MTQSGFASPESPELDPAAWAATEAMILAGAETTPDDFLAACRRCSQDLSLRQQRAVGVYLGYLLRAGVRLAGRSAQADDLYPLAESLHAQVALHLGITTDDIWRTLGAAHDIAMPGAAVTRGDFAVFASAILGALIRAYGIDLGGLRASLARWHRSHHAEIEALIADR